MPRKRWRSGGAQDVTGKVGESNFALQGRQGGSRAKSKRACAECFRPLSVYSKTPFCGSCETELFGFEGYKPFLRSRAVRQRVAKERQGARVLWCGHKSVWATNRCVICGDPPKGQQ